MAKSRAKIVAEFADNIESAGGAFPEVSGVDVYANVDVRPANNNSIGDQAFISSTSELFVWTGSDWHSIDTTAPPPPGPSSPLQGTVSGYSSGGLEPAYSNIIDKFPFATDANATDVGDLSQARFVPAGQSSSTHGFNSGGYESVTPGITNTIDKFPFATDANATDVGDLTQARSYLAGQSSSDNGYSSGGDPGTNVIDKFSFATDANATDVGDLTFARSFTPAGQSSSENGYTSGGLTPSPDTITNIIDKFPFATDANATDVGDLTQARRNVAGQSSSESGYTSGGWAPPTVNTIDKFPFATDANATDVGDLTQARSHLAGQSSSDNGYTSGGTSPGNSNVIDKFPFATDANATDVGDLTVARQALTGQQD